MQMLSSLLEKKFIGTDELRKELTDIVENKLHKLKELIITQNGKPVAVLMDLEYYIKLINKLNTHKTL